MKKIVTFFKILWQAIEEAQIARAQHMLKSRTWIE
jgi:hypothetical protein